MFLLQDLGGKLIIAPAEKNHSGAYVCVARNPVGVRESRAARLSVLGETETKNHWFTTAYTHTEHRSELLLCCTAAKPVLLLKPENVSVRTGESAQFYCHAKGDPPPAVVWSRERGPLPNGRYFVMQDTQIEAHAPDQRSLMESLYALSLNTAGYGKHEFVVNFRAVVILQNYSNLPTSTCQYVSSC